MKCQQLLGPTDKPRRCSVPATYTIECTQAMKDCGVINEYKQHLCVAHARRVAATMNREFWQVTRDRDGQAL